MGLLGLSAMEWFVVLDLFVLMASTTIAAALFVRIRSRDRARRLLRPRAPVSEQESPE